MPARETSAGGARVPGTATPFGPIRPSPNGGQFGRPRQRPGPAGTALGRPVRVVNVAFTTSGRRDGGAAKNRQVAAAARGKAGRSRWGKRRGRRSGRGWRPAAPCARRPAEAVANGVTLSAAAASGWPAKARVEPLGLRRLARPHDEGRRAGWPATSARGPRSSGGEEDTDRPRDVRGLEGGAPDRGGAAFARRRARHGR